MCVHPPVVPLSVLLLSVYSLPPPAACHVPACTHARTPRCLQSARRYLFGPALSPLFVASHRVCPHAPSNRTAAPASSRRLQPAAAASESGSSAAGTCSAHTDSPARGLLGRARKPGRFAARCSVPLAGNTVPVWCCWADAQGEEEGCKSSWRSVEVWVQSLAVVFTATDKFFF